MVRSPKSKAGKDQRALDSGLKTSDLRLWTLDFGLWTSDSRLMIVLLGASGYIGQAFAQALAKGKQPFRTLARKELDYTRYDVLLEFLRETRPSFLINAAGYTGKPNVDACELAKADTL